MNLLGAEPHHDGSARYLSNVAPGVGERVEVRLRVPAGVRAPTLVHVRAVTDGEPKYTTAKIAETEPGDDGAVWWVGEVGVVNPVTSYRFLVETPSGPRWVNGCGTSRRDVADRDDFVVSTFAPPPDWLADAVCYEIFPDRFARGIDEQDWVDPDGDWAIESDWDTPIAGDWKRAVRQLYRGDLVGVRQRLDHLERLGVNLIYLTPVFPGRSCHRYDASTFDNVDPVLGGDAALSALIDAAHRRGIRVIGDLTTNHSGNHHRWFETAQADAGSPEAGYYFFTEHPHDYVGWFDVPTLPKFDLRSAELRRALAGTDGVVARWLRGPAGDGADGFDGWRIDVGNMTGRHGAIDVNHDVFRDVRATMAAVRSDAWLVGEHLHDASGDLAGDGWHGVMACWWFTRPVWSWLAEPSARLLGVPGPLPGVGGDGLVDTMRALTAGVPWRSVTEQHDAARQSRHAAVLNRRPFAAAPAGGRRAAADDARRTDGVCRRRGRCRRPHIGLGASAVSLGRVRLGPRPPRNVPEPDRPAPWHGGLAPGKHALCRGRTTTPSPSSARPLTNPCSSMRRELTTRRSRSGAATSG